MEGPGSKDGRHSGDVDRGPPSPTRTSTPSSTEFAALPLASQADGFENASQDAPHACGHSGRWSPSDPGSFVE